MFREEFGSVRREIEEVKELLVPRTEDVTEQDTPAILPPPPENQINLQVNAGYVEPEWGIYEHKVVGPDYSYRQLFPHVNNVNGGNRYSLSKTQKHYWVKDGRDTLFRCGRNNYCGRNLYLELFAAGYRCDQWIENRNRTETDYPNAHTPPNFLGAR